MLSSKQKKTLEQQGYRLIENHSAVKICGWTKNCIAGKGSCYKHKFYGIKSNQCLQMTTSLHCANQCLFCWRDYKLAAKKWPLSESETSNPKTIIDESIKAQQKLLKGFGGNTNPNPTKTPYEESKSIKHVALSLIGESILYPKINELIYEFNKRKISTFVVTNAQYPDLIKNLKPVTQLYISLDAPNSELLKKLDKPIFEDYWQRLNESLESLSKKKHRTCIRLTLIKNLNILSPDAYAKLIKKGNPDFVEVKAYMSIGASLKNFKFENMPNSKEIMQFTESLVKFLPDYEIVSEHYESRVVLLAKKKFKGKTWIDFDKYNEMVNDNQEPETMKYLKKTPPMFVLKDNNV